MQNDIEQLLQLQDLKQLSKFILVVMITWSIGLLFLTSTFIKKLKKDNYKLWVFIGKPTIFRENIKLIKFLLGNKTKELSKELFSYARLIKIMIYIGVILVVSLLSSFYYLYEIF